MKRVVLNRLTSMLFFASLLLVAAHMPANAAAHATIDFTPATAADIAVDSFMGEYDFDLYNRTNGWVLNGFFTQEDGKWSKNWLRSKLQPGKSFRMMWSSASDKGACVVPFKVTWDDYETAELYKLDWCKGIKSVYLKDDTFTVDYK